jgi:hypothetical protein
MAAATTGLVPLVPCPDVAVVDDSLDAPADALARTPAREPL